MVAQERCMEDDMLMSMSTEDFIAELSGKPAVGEPAGSSNFTWC